VLVGTPNDDYRPRPVVSKVSTSPPAVIETETKDAIEEEILESVPKTMKTKASRCSFRLSDVFPAVLVTNQILWNICFS
jgi:hypothetical protein